MSTNKINPMWGGRFAQGSSQLMAKINQSVSIDHKLYAEDIEGSIAHVKMLAKQSIITNSESEQIISGLLQIKNEIETENFQFKPELEDIHMNIEARLTEIIGSTAGKLHTARSRNDQVATDLKLYIRKQLQDLDITVQQLQKSLITKAENNINTLMPGFTHLQVAQPISFGHYLMAYFEMFKRDRWRIKAALKHIDECPLGAAALAGTSFPIDRHFTAQLLGFTSPTLNSLDTVSDRDFALEFLFIASVIAMHLSRLCEELIIYSNSCFNFVRLSENYSSGSSIMPQKRNPDSVELIRAKSGKIFGNLTSLFIIMKALPLAYNKDMQDDKLPVFETAETILLITTLAQGIIDELEVNQSSMYKALEEGYPTATDVADWLVKEFNMPFREAHHIVGQIIRLAESKKCNLKELSIKDIQKIHADIDTGIFTLMDVNSSIASRTSFGGTAYTMVKKAIENAKRELE